MKILSCKINNKTFSDKKEKVNPNEFRNYAHNLMKQAHGDNYSEEKTNQVVDGLLKDHPDATFGELVGRIKSGLGK